MGKKQQAKPKCSPLDDMSETSATGTAADKKQEQRPPAEGNERVGLSITESRLTKLIGRVFEGAHSDMARIAHRAGRRSEIANPAIASPGPAKRSGLPAVTDYRPAEEKADPSSGE